MLESFPKSCWKIVLTGPLRDGFEGEVRNIVPSSTVVVAPTADDVAKEIADAHILAAGELSDATLATARNLKWIHSWAAGPDRILGDALTASPIVLTSCKGNGAVPLAEHAVMMMLMLDRDARRSLSAQTEHRWDRFYHGELNGKTCGIIGTGNSGIDLAGKLKAFHMRVLGMRRTDMPARNFDAIYPRSELRKFLSECDFVVISAALTPDTYHMLGTEEFRAMKPSAYYICYSRGAIAQTDALVHALQEGWIAGAGLDAHEKEPLPENSPVWDMPNVLITAHAGALSSATRNRGYGFFLSNLEHLIAGRPLTNVVDKKVGY